MNIAETLRGLGRRWYIVVPGLVLAAALAVASFAIIKPGYERSATQLLLPGPGLVPEGTTNPYLFLGGLTQAADILVRSLGSEESLAPIAQEYPGTEFSITRDPLTAGPVVLLTVTAGDDEAAEGALDQLMEQSVATLDRLQAQQGVRDDDRISISELTRDVTSTLQQRNRMVISAVAGIGMVVVTLVVASLVDGLSRRVRRRGRTGATTAAPNVDGEVEDGADLDDAADADPQPLDTQWIVDASVPDGSGDAPETASLDRGRP